jgi:sugar lactone lactonase YvrE
MNSHRLIPVVLLAAAAGTLLTACSSTAPTPELTQPRELIVYPTPPDTPRIQFLTRYSTSADIEPERRRSIWESIAGEDDSANEEKQIVKPYGVAMAQGRIYVCDTGAIAVDIIDIPAQSLSRFQPRSFGKLSKPLGCFADESDGSLFVADADRQQVVVYGNDGSYRASFGERESIRPSAVFVVGDSIFAADLNGQRVAVYARSDQRLLGFIPADTTDPAARLFAPTNLFVTNDHVYVTDFGSFQVKIYDRNGRFVRTLGRYGSGLGQFVRPKGVAVDRNSNVYVVDAGFENVQVFDAEGKLLMFFGGPYEGPGDLYLPAGITIDYENVDLFRHLVHPGFQLKYLVLVTSQYGPDKVNVYGFIGPEETPSHAP